jgi:hypothetical protein
MSVPIVRLLLILVVMLALTVLAAACYLPPPRPLPESPTATAAPAAPAPTAASPAAPVTATLTLDQLKNHAYALEQAPGGKAALVNGKFEAAIGAGATQTVTVTLTESVAIGDLNGDGAADAAVVLATSTGGTGVFKSLHVAVNNGGKPSDAAFAFLGDRVQIKSLAIHADTAGAILVDMLTHGPKDPQCCPTMAVVQTYKLQGNTLVLLSVVQKPTIRLSQ